MTNLESQLKDLLALGDDFDGEGSRAPKSATVERARKSVYAICTHMKTMKQIDLGDPQVNVGPNGSVDLHWKTREYELLLNVPEGSGLRKFYYERFGKDVIKDGELI